MVGEVGAALAALFPARPEHEVVDDQLAPAGEQVGQGLLTIRAGEMVGFVHPHPRQPAALRAQPITRGGKFLLALQVPSPRAQPLLALYHLVLHGHDSPAWRACAIKSW